MIIMTLTLTGRESGYQSNDGQKLVVILSGDTFDKKEMIKELGYQWISEQKHWVKIVPPTKTSMGAAKQDAIKLDLSQSSISVELTKDEAIKIMQS